MLHSLLLLVLLVVLQGCTNPYTQFYTPADLVTSTQFIPSTGEPKVIRGGNPEADDLAMMESGHRLLGHSSFNSGSVAEDGAVAHAKTLGAAVVIVYSRFTHSVSGSMPMTLPSSETSNTTLSGMAGGQQVYGTATTTTYGTTTTHIPYTVNRSDYLATYWGKLPPAVFGAFVREPKPEERRQIGSNTGLLITVVVKGSPAFSADLFRGDVIKSIAGAPLRDLQDFRATLSRSAGQAIDIIILRDGKEFQKTVHLNRRP